MPRVQLALNVSDLEASVSFYSKLFATEPAKRRPGYANFAVADPPLKLVLIENPGSGGSINHLGVEVADADATIARLRSFGAEVALPPWVEAGKYRIGFVRDPDGIWVEVQSLIRPSPAA